MLSRPRTAPRGLRWQLSILGWVLATAAAYGADEVEVSARAAAGGGVEVRARATVAAAHALIWQVLTDYDNLAGFIPGMHKSRVVQWLGHSARVEQEGVAHLLFFSYPINVTVEAAHQPPDAISVRLIRGNLKRLEGGYRIVRAGDGADRFVLHWTGVIEPEVGLPDLIGVPLIRDSIGEQFLGMVAEIERRHAAQTRAPRAKPGE